MQRPDERQSEFQTDAYMPMSESFDDFLVGAGHMVHELVETAPTYCRNGRPGCGDRAQGTPHPGTQLLITDADGHRVTAFATNISRGQLADLELRHRRRACCESTESASRKTLD